jgi:hypothetical protein
MSLSPIMHDPYLASGLLISLIALSIPLILYLIKNKKQKHLIHHVIKQNAR